MDDELRHVAEHMKGLGFGALHHSLWLALYRSRENPRWPELGVLHAAHAAEILIKARIAEEHPLLFFEEIPRMTQVAGDRLRYEDLFNKGKTLQFNELPDRLWATTGVRLPNLDLYKDFGRLRNAIQHFTSPPDDPSTATLRFVFSVVDPFINDEWGVFAIDYNEEYGDHYEHVFEALVDHNIRPRLSPTAAKAWRNEDPGPHAPDGYREWLQRAVTEALDDA